MCKSVNRHSRGLSRHRIKWLVTWKCEKFCYLDDKIGGRGVHLLGVCYNRLRIGWSKFRDLVPC